MAENHTGKPEDDERANRLRGLKEIHDPFKPAPPPDVLDTRHAEPAELENEE